MANIAIDARPLCNPPDGIGRYTLEILTRLLRHKEHTWFLYSNLPTLTTFADAETRTAPNGFSNSLLCSQSIFPRWLVADSINAFWAPRHHLPIASKVPAVVSIHDLAWLAAPSTMPIARRLQERWLMPPSIRRADAVTTVSESTRRQVVALVPESDTKLKIVPPGRSHPPTGGSRPQIRPYLLAVGTFEPRKNHALLLNAFAKVASEIRHDLVLIGRPGWGDVNVARTLAELSLQSRVHIIEGADDALLLSYYQHADFLISTSLYEGFNIPLLEALSSETPVMVTDLAVHREVAGQAALYFQPNLEALCSSLKRVSVDTDLRAQLAVKCATQANKFSWDKSATTLLNILTDLCQ